MTHPELSIILPAYNEVSYLAATISNVAKTFPFARDSVEIILVDDGSIDETPRIAAELSQHHPNLRYIRHAVNQGKGAALRRGTLESRGDIVVFLDADGDVPPMECAKLVEALRARTDLAIAVGSKRLAASAALGTHPGALRAILRSAGNLLVRALVVRGIRDTQCGAKAFKGQIARELAGVAVMPGWSFDLEMLALAQRKGYCIAEMPVTWRESSTSHVGLRAYLATLRDVCTIFYRLHTGFYHFL